MVAGKNALSGGADMLSVVSKINTAKPKKNNDSEFKTTVSYTHLTLPTICSV